MGNRKWEMSINSIEVAQVRSRRREVLNAVKNLVVP
jgi:hypothetical protein